MPQEESDSAQPDEGGGAGGLMENAEHAASATGVGEQLATPLAAAKMGNELIEASDSAAEGEQGGTYDEMPGAALPSPDLGKGASAAAPQSNGGLLKSLLSHGAAHVMNGAHTVGGYGVAGLQSAINGVMGLGGSVSAALGGAVSAGGAAATLTAGAVATTGFATMALLGGGDTTILDGALVTNNCGQQVADAVNAADATSGKLDAAAVSAKQLEVAKQMYSVLHKAGVPNVTIAGIFGNFSAEGAMDPTAIESISEPGGQPFVYDEAHKKAEATGFDISVYAPRSWREVYGSRKIKPAGIGLMQWTMDRNTNLINFSKKVGKPWYDAGVQAAFLLKADPISVTTIKEMNSMKTPSEAAWHFEDKAENPGKKEQSRAKREQAAEGWMARLSDFKVDDAYADSILSMAGGAGEAAAVEAASDQLKSCASTSMNSDNSSLVKANISFAWPFRQQSIDDESKGEDNRGTDLYQELHKEIWGSNQYANNPLSSCDNNVSTAVVWSGTDDKFPEQNVANQKTYFHGEGASKWEKVDWGMDVKKLQPGDIFNGIAPGLSHTFMYLGPDSIKEFYKGDLSKFQKGADSSSASHCPGCGHNEANRSPGLNNSFQEGTNASGFQQIGGYEVFRAKGHTGGKFSEYKPHSSVMGQ